MLHVVEAEATAEYYGPGVVVFDSGGNPQSVSPAAERWIEEIVEVAPAPRLAREHAFGPIRPSFNCRYAKTAVELAICADPVLAAKDRTGHGSAGTCRPLAGTHAIGLVAAAVRDEAVRRRRRVHRRHHPTRDAA